MMSTINSAREGMMAALVRFDSTAARLVGAGTGRTGPAEEGDLVSAMVGLQTQQVAFAANALVLKTTDEMLGTMIDLIA